MSIEDAAGEDPATYEDGEEAPETTATSAVAGAPPSRALTTEEVKMMLAGFYDGTFGVVTEPSKKTAPVIVTTTYGEVSRKYKLWVFRIKTGGGLGPVKGNRSENERRIQVSNGPKDPADYTNPEFTTLLIGYNVEEDEIVVFDRRWLEHYTDAYGSKGLKGSSSAHIDVGHFGSEAGTRPVVKTAEFGPATSYVLKPGKFPEFLASSDHSGLYFEPKSSPMATRGDASDVEAYCREKGYVFDPDLIARYVASLVSKPFVILAGISGTGKSKLAELVAEFYSLPAREVFAEPEDEAGVSTGPGYEFTSRLDTSGFGRVTLVPVRPDWIDNKSILGFMNPVTAGYESTLALDIILRAHAKPADRHFMILDEMNLAKVEHYFSDWLACTESRRPGPHGTVVQQSVPLHRASTAVGTIMQNAFGATEEVPIPRALALPVNLIVTGTVNVDETTNGFSPKVLDRAMVLEFDEVNLERLRTGLTDADGHDYRFPAVLPPFELPGRQGYADLPLATHQHVVAINGILEEARLHVGYRAVTEMALFIRCYDAILPEDTGDVDLLRALDVAILQKVLPRISGHRARLERPLARLCLYLRDLSIPDAADDPGAFLPSDKAALGKSYRRALEMWDTLNAYGYASFFK